MRVSPWLREWLASPELHPSAPHVDMDVVAEQWRGLVRNARWVGNSGSGGEVTDADSAPARVNTRPLLCST